MVGIMEEIVLSALSHYESIQIFRKAPSCQLLSPCSFDNWALMSFHPHSALYKGFGKFLLFRVLLFYFVLLYLLRKLLRLHCSSILMVQINIIEVTEKKDIAVSDPSLAPVNVFYFPLSKWEDSNTWDCMTLKNPSMIATPASDPKFFYWPLSQKF
ncbi:hypothetical protein AMTRI_Chr04g247630 [Amborella trichopoda]|uniref:Uncharacterized protein n=1 Tax=Amborella trichopoda TaxID=13333 RepID=W1NY93_AMBTC|nr:hypothetical protein AMTR_s00091p00128090 [Amborella trichopoda]